MELFNKPSNQLGAQLQVVLMTQSGAEGLNFQCVRQVHILERIDMVRLTQVCGRARRHPAVRVVADGQRNVVLFLYIMSFRSIPSGIRTRWQRHHRGPLAVDGRAHPRDGQKKELLNRTFQRTIAECTVDRGLYDAGEVKPLAILRVRRPRHLPNFDDRKEELNLVRSMDCIPNYVPKIVPTKARSPWKMKDGSVLDGQKVYYSRTIRDDHVVKELYTRAEPPKLLGEIIGYEFIPAF